MIDLKGKLLPSSGFTLAELLVVVAIFALTASIAVPFYRTAAMNLSLNAAGRDLASDLRLAQQLSVTTQISHEIVFNQAGNSYLVRNSVTGATIKNISIKPPATILSVSGLDGSTAAFNATGAAAQAGTIILANPNGRETLIDIKPSGYVKLQ